MVYRVKSLEIEEGEPFIASDNIHICHVNISIPDIRCYYEGELKAKWQIVYIEGSEE